MTDPLVIAGEILSSRLFLGTGKFSDPTVQNQAIAVSGTEVLTFAVRRVNLERPNDDAILQDLQGKNFRFLPNTSGARTADEAVRIARLVKATGISNWIKVEICANDKTLLPDPVETLKATEQLVKEGFVALPYTSDDPILCKRLEEVGASAVMPGGSPIGTGLGILNPYNLSLIIEEANVPIIIDAGLGSAKDVAEAMELGADGILLNTAVANASDPVQMAEAMKLAIKAGRLAYLAGRIPKRRYASASSATTGYFTR